MDKHSLNEKEKNVIKQSLFEIEKQMKEESNERKTIIDEVNKNIDNYSFQMNNYEKIIRGNELKEIKYQNQERELEELKNIYDLKCKDLDASITKSQNEIINLRKKILNQNNVISNLKSIVTSIVNEDGLDKLSSITGIEKDNIEKYLQD